MDTSMRPYVIVGCVLLSIALAFYWFWPEPDRGIDWREKYRQESRDPYGTNVLHELLRDRIGSFSFTEVTDSLQQVLDPAPESAASYVFVGDGILLDSFSQEALLEFVGAGNNAFISSNSIPVKLLSLFYDPICDGYEWSDYLFESDTLAWVELSHPEPADTLEFDLYYQYRRRVVPYSWCYIDDWAFCEELDSPEELGQVFGYAVNFARYRFGEGSFYLHTTPLAFTNFHLRRPEGLAYAEGVFSHLPDGPVYWDEHHQISAVLSRRLNELYAQGQQRRLNNEGPLQYILSQPPLAWAWYIGLGLVLSYLFFRAKRRQRIIPVLEPNTNTSLEFVSTIGRLYFIQNKHRKLAQQQMKLFLAYVRDRYHLPTRELNDQFTRQLTVRSDVPAELIARILRFHRNIESSGFLSEKSLVDFHRTLESFYKNCK